MQRKNSSRKTKKRAKPATKATRNWLIKNNFDSKSFRIKENGQANACPFLIAFLAPLFNNFSAKSRLTKIFGSFPCRSAIV